MKSIDLSQWSEQELQAELQKRQQAQNQARRAYKDLVNSSLTENIIRLKELSDQISQSKLFVFQSLKTLLDIKNEVYSAKGDQ